MNVLFLGAGKRLSLLESFRRAGIAEEIDLRLFAVELTDLVPIAEVAEVLVGPSFFSPEFPDFLLATIQRHAIDMVIPNMDAATVILAQMKHDLEQHGCSAVVSDHALCAAMYDKALASAWFSAHGVAQPRRDGYPCIAKSRLGYGSRDQCVAQGSAELTAFLGRADTDRYFVKYFVNGHEYTVDAYARS